ncbi:hypothetical protein DFJ67_1757 [Asanoa ferruginea]|uniref:Uncharacterized protein n=1 Tax=Asanoa ferruginea TaxID=53367 RepID=A0A3D9ZEW4_9ACTN|nr:hypothetical protein DFJ67_1757 [Asanoa ferruginea]GIF51277.1 hypothetical protein Afe04nite_58160 [Asanoa ferruginea]
MLLRTDARPTTEVGVPPGGGVGMCEISDAGVGRVQAGEAGQSAPSAAGGGGAS